MESIVKINSIVLLTHDVLRIRTEKPTSFDFQPGQAADISINKPDWEDKRNAFTFTSLPENDYLEFTIKTYPAHQGVTAAMLTLVPGDELIIHDVFGSIGYKGPGIFIAGGAGITPFIAIFRALEKRGEVAGNKLLFANKSEADIIQGGYFSRLLGSDFINVLSGEEKEGYETGYVTEDLIRKLMAPGLKYYYLCGPDPMMVAVQQELAKLGVAPEYMVYEQF